MPQLDLDVLLQLAGRGWRLFPTHSAIAVGASGGRDARLACTCGRPCNAPAKHPRVKEWQRAAAADAAASERGHRKWPDANWAVATGGGLVVVDVDTSAQAGVLAGLARVHGPFPATLQATTGRGRHLYFAGDVG